VAGPAALLSKKDGAGGGELDNDGDRQQDQRPEDESIRPSRRQCQSAVYRRAARKFSGGAENQQWFPVKIIHSGPGRWRSSRSRPPATPRRLPPRRPGSLFSISLNAVWLDVEDHAATGRLCKQHGELGEKVCCWDPAGRRRRRLHSGCSSRVICKFDVPLSDPPG